MATADETRLPKDGSSLRMLVAYCRCCSANLRGGYRDFHLLEHQSPKIALFGKAKSVVIQVRNIYEKGAL